MAEAQRILLPVHTTAWWGGLQDWAVGLVRGLHDLGREVDVVTNNQLVAERCAGAAHVIDVDWANWRASLPELLQRAPWDIVFAQPFGGMEMGLHLSEELRIPLAYMSHGNSSDRGYTWSDKVDGVLLASESLREMMVLFNGIDPSLVHVLANGASSAFFSDPLPGLEGRIAEDGTVRLVLASRLSADKLNQIPAMELAVGALLEHPDVTGIRIEVFGGGPMSAVFESRLGLLARNPRVKLDMAGWVDEKVISSRFRGALLSVGGGVSGTQSLCLGTAVLGAGIRGVVGISTPDNLDLVVSTNFGDHSARRISPDGIRRDVAWLVDDSHYRAMQDACLARMRPARAHAEVARRAASLLDDAVGRGRRRLG